MEIHENMYYGVGKVALAIAKADGEITTKEIVALKEKLKETEAAVGVDLELINITFEYFKKYEKATAKDLLEEGIHNFHLGDDHLTPKLAKGFKHLLITIAAAQPPITVEEDMVLTKFLDYLESREMARTWQNN